MHPFKYGKTVDLKEAINQLGSQPKANLIAGGTTLVDLLRLNVVTANHLIDINQLPIANIEIFEAKSSPEIGARIGALARNTDVAMHKQIIKNYPLISQAILSGASPQLRNMATVGGNVMQRTRCAYFRDTAVPCNKREPGSGCPAIGGLNRSHAILGTSESCIAVHASDMCVALVALDAQVLLSGPQGERKVALVDFYLLPGNHPEKENLLKPGEIIVQVELPHSPFAKHSHYLKVRDRESFSFALVSAACALEIKNGKIVDARIALGGVATKPWRALDAEKLLLGQSPSEGLFAKAGEVSILGAKPQKSNAFKVELTKRTVKRALLAAVGE
jgi:xanthine dehydrogenase YagS FAD-binding subunit